VSGDGEGTAPGVDSGDAVAAGVAGAGVGEADVSVATVRDGAGDGSAATRMPQPASSIAAPAAASTPACHQGVCVSLLTAA
jgi:hypothetical protein